MYRLLHVTGYILQLKYYLTGCIIQFLGPRGSPQNKTIY